MKQLRKILSLLCALTMVLTFLSIPALAEETATVIAYNYVPLTDSAPVRAAVKKMQAGEDAELRYYNFYDRNDCQGIDGMRLTVKDGVAAFQELSLIHI